MRSTTLVLVTISGEVDASAVAARVGQAANVTAITRNPGEDGDDTRQVWAGLERVRSTYALTDADPVGDLCAAYREAWQTRRLERFDAAALERPASAKADFYLVLDDGAEELDVDSDRHLLREWFLGVVARAAPQRVVALQHTSSVAAAAGAVLDALGSLPAGPELPDAEGLVATARTRVPGQRDTV